MTNQWPLLPTNTLNYKFSDSSINIQTFKCKGDFSTKFSILCAQTAFFSCSSQKSMPQSCLCKFYFCSKKWLKQQCNRPFSCSHRHRIRSILCGYCIHSAFITELLIILAIYKLLSRMEDQNVAKHELARILC